MTQDLQATVLTTALMGTTQRQLTLPDSAGSVNGLLVQLPEADPEGKLLSAAAVSMLYQQCGMLPPSLKTARPEQCAADPTPICNPLAIQHLRVLLGGQFAEVLPEWLAAAAAKGWRVPEELLPELLEAGRAKSELRPKILQVIGTRGRWLAAFNPQWGYVVGEDVAESWETGSKQARLLVFKGWRETDPTLAREKLTEVWSHESAEERAGFLRTLEINLSGQDEPFLEEKLQDRSKEVRRVAANLLAQLPQSAYCQRMAERVLPLLSLGAKGKSIEVTLPAAYTKAMSNDEIDQKSPARNIGEKAWWLMEMIRATPLRLWEEKFNLSPEKLVELTNDNDFKNVLLGGWVTATVRQKDVSWATALFRHSFSFNDTQGRLRDVASIFPSELSEQLLLEFLDLYNTQKKLEPINPIKQLLDSHPHPWSLQLSRALLKFLQKEVMTYKDGVNYPFASYLYNFGFHFHPTVALEAAKGWPTGSAGWENISGALDRFQAILQFRYDMLKELN